MNIKEQSAKTTNEQSTEAQVITGRHSNGNTHVVGSKSPRLVVETLTESEIESDYASNEFRKLSLSVKNLVNEYKLKTGLDVYYNMSVIELSDK